MDLEKIIYEALDGRLRVLIETCNTAGDREFLAVRLAEEISAVEQASWSKEWPMEPGYYWFYGWCWKDRSDDPEMHLVRVSCDRRGTYRITNGHFIWKIEGGEGYWAPARLPEPPSDLGGSDEESSR